MSKSILIAGKDLPEAADFADGAEIKMRSVAVTNSSEPNTAVLSNVKVFPWFRTSPVSSRTLVLDCETAFRRLDEAVLYFDEAYFAGKFNSLAMQDCSQAADETILSYQYLALEILSRFEKRSSLASSAENESTPKLVFIIKHTASECDVKKNPSLRSAVPMASNPFVAAAAAAFEAFAENIAAIYHGRKYVDIILAGGAFNNEAASNDKAIGEWLCTYLDEFDSQKSKPSVKQSLSWVKIGAKYSRFSLF